MLETPAIKAATCQAAIAAGASLRAWAIGRILSLVDRLIVPLSGAGIELARAADPHVRIGNHLLPMRDPAGSARDGEQHGEHGARYPQGAIDDARIEVDVGIELARHEILVLERDLLELQGELEQRMAGASELLEHAIVHLANDLGARIEILVDPMSESHQPYALR